jgi:phosphoglycerol transferase
VTFARQSGYLKDTNIAIVGDHLAVSNPLGDRLRAVPDRRVFNLFISEPPAQRNRDDLVSFDLFPTLVEFAGFEVSGGRLGLGYSAFNTPQAIASAERLQDFTRPTLTFSETYRKLWDKP